MQRGRHDTFKKDELAMHFDAIHIYEQSNLIVQDKNIEESQPQSQHQLRGVGANFAKRLIINILQCIFV